MIIYPLETNENLILTNQINFHEPKTLKLAQESKVFIYKQWGTPLFSDWCNNETKLKGVSQILTAIITIAARKKERLLNHHHADVEILYLAAEKPPMLEFSMSSFKDIRNLWF